MPKWLRLLASLRFLVGCFRIPRKTGGRQDLSSAYADPFHPGDDSPGHIGLFSEPAKDRYRQAWRALWCPERRICRSGRARLLCRNGNGQSINRRACHFSFPLAHRRACGQPAQGTNEPSPDVRNWFSLALDLYPFDLIDSMSAWLGYSLLVIVLWGIVGLLQKLGTNRVSANSLLIWLMVGYVLLIPWLLSTTRLSDLTPRDTVIGTLAGITNGLGAWYLFASLESGAKASVAIPLTALNPLLTILLAMIFLSERLTALQWVGIIIAIIAGAMISYETSETGNSPKSV